MQSNEKMEDSYEARARSEKMDKWDMRPGRRWYWIVRRTSGGRALRVVLDIACNEFTDSGWIRRVLLE